MMWSPFQAVSRLLVQSSKTCLSHSNLLHRPFTQALSTAASSTLFHTDRLVATKSVSLTTKVSSHPFQLRSTSGSNVHRSPLLVNSLGPLVTITRGYNAALRPRLICPGCYFVWRHGRKHVECSDHPRHKQMKKLVKRKIWKEDYSKGNVQKAMQWYRVEPRQCARTVDRTAMAHNWVAGRIGKEI